MMLFAAGDWLNTWLTPLWLLGLGSLLGLALLLVGWLALTIVSRRGSSAIPLAVSEGPLQPVFWTVTVVALFGVLGYFLIRDAGEILQSIARVPFTGTEQRVLTIEGAPEDEDAQPFELLMPYEATELRTIELESERSLKVVSPVEVAGIPIMEWDVEASDPFTWDRGVLLNNPFEQEGMDKLLVYNQSDQPAELTIRVMTAPLHPQASSVLITAIAVVAVFLAYLLLRWLFPKISAIALATAKSEMATPLYLMILGLGIFLICLFMYIPYHTFGEDIKVLKDSGLTLIMIGAIIHAIWAASTSVAEEIEGKTALTVLSKPIGRRQFILGKFFGIGWSTAVLFIVMGVVLLVVVAYKPIYDARETSNTDPTWQECHLEMVRTVPGLFLAYLETLVFAAIGVAISTRLPMLANIMICFAIYAFGHLTPLLVQGSSGQFENVKFVARFIATVLPVLDHFNIQAAVAAGVGVSYQYLFWATVYCAVYCTVAMLLALVLFEDRDLA